MVLLTVYYMVATGVQTWKLRGIYQKVAKVLDSKSSVVFLKKSDGSSEGSLINLFIFQEVERFANFRHDSGPGFVRSLHKLQRSHRR